MLIYDNIKDQRALKKNNKKFKTLKNGFPHILFMICCQEFFFEQKQYFFKGNYLFKP